MHKLKESTELEDFQKEGVLFASSLKYCAINDDMGLGKTVQALAVACNFGKKTLVICPPFLVQNWLHEIEKFTHLKAKSYNHKKPKIDEKAEIIVASYTQLKHMRELFSWASFIITDESQYLKNLESQRTSHFFEYFRKTPPEKYLSLSGTPIKNRLPEIYPFLLLLSMCPDTNPKITDKYDTLYKFCVRFTHISNNKYGGFKCDGMKNVEELRKYVNPYVIRRLDTIAKLPQMTESTVIASFKDNPALEKEFEDSMKAPLINTPAKVEAAVATAHFTASFVKNLLENGKKQVVVFSDHKKPIYGIGQNLDNVEFALIDGTVDKVKRDILVRQFQEGMYQVLLCTIGAASSGFNMTKADAIVFNDFPWVPGDMKQAKKRIHRMGQKKETNCYIVIGSKAADTILKTLTKKNKVLSEVSKWGQ